MSTFPTLPSLPTQQDSGTATSDVERRDSLPSPFRLPLRVGIGWQGRCEKDPSLRTLRNQGTHFFFALLRFYFLLLFPAVAMAVEIDHLVRCGEAQIRTEGMI